MKYAQIEVEQRLVGEVLNVGTAVYGSPEGSGTLLSMIGTGINVLLSLLAIILLFYILYAGFLWMTAGGEEDNIKKAQGILRNAVIGLVIILASYSITLFVGRAIQAGGLTQTQTTQTTPQ